MKRERLLHIVLAIVGIGALTAYLVACRPSWSPDGSKVLFPYFHVGGDKSEIGLALFDKNTGKAKSILTTEPTLDSLGPWAHWDRKGEKAIVSWVERVEGKPNRLRVQIMRIGAKKPERTFVVPEVEILPGFQLPEVAGGLFVGGKSLARLDLETGKVQRRKLDGKQGVVLVGQKNQICYCGDSRGPTKGYEIGTVDPKTLALKPALTLRREEVGEVSPFIAAAKDGSAIALMGKKDHRYHLLIVAGSKLQKSILLELPPATHELGNLDFSPDGKTIYAALVTKAKGKRRYQLGIAEAAVSSGAVRVIPLLHVQLSDGTEESALLLFFQVALSPDGKTAAASPTCFPEGYEDEKDRALYLVDLTTPERTVTKVPPPSAAAGKK